MNWAHYFSIAAIWWPIVALVYALAYHVGKAKGSQNYWVGYTQGVLDEYHDVNTDTRTLTHAKMQVADVVAKRLDKAVRDEMIKEIVDKADAENAEAINEISP